ncbi:MAG TPA: hypothetical protein VG795_14350, partial [Acidimicrobiia bacterium]|nr:hypothetical protein [Acidimicrobiia bacterium]
MSDQDLLPQLHPQFAESSRRFCRIRKKPDDEVISALKTLPERKDQSTADLPHVTVVAGDPPMLRLEINLYSWERGDSE